jgi:cyclophilin family peptidyl-prolyl cis-trans isomerase
VELEFVDDADKEIYPRPDMEITILLWPDTPHAIWIWLEQVGRHVWDDSVFEWDAKQTVLELSPSKEDPLKRGRLEFVKHHNPNVHGAWTIGLRQTKDTGKLQMFINLQDNAYYLKHESCVGKILDGFDALHRLLKANRAVGDLSVVHVKRVNAMHMTQREIGYY